MGFVASIPAIAGFIGGLLGGVFSELAIKARLQPDGCSLRLPVICGMLLSCVIVIANYTSLRICGYRGDESGIFSLKALAIGMVRTSDTSPKVVLGIAGGVFNMCGNMASIITRLVIGVEIVAIPSHSITPLYVGSMGLIRPDFSICLS